MLFNFYGGKTSNTRGKGVFQGLQMTECINRKFNLLAINTDNSG